jgi:hypothetical protein
MESHENDGGNWASEPIPGKINCSYCHKEFDEGFHTYYFIYCISCYLRIHQRSCGCEKFISLHVISS